MKKSHIFFPLVIALVFGVYSPLISQSIPSSSIYHELLKLRETKRVLYVAAHPDDENTRLIAYLANETKAQVAYLSLTRGDGGQNLIGPELGIGLGQIRTQELLKARETDGGRQFFTRAKDFGYSKNPNETLQNWDRETILSDVVWVVRKFRPDIIITRFNTIPGVTHGHHTTSAILAEEAFSLAGDPTAFTDQLQYVEPWSPKRIFWNAYNFRGEFQEEEGEIYFEFPTGNFNPLLGETYSQIAADSRTMHKSQGFGSTAGIGNAVDHIQFIQGESFSDSPFDGVVDRWESFETGKEARELIDGLIQNFDFKSPSSNLSDLLTIKAKIDQLPEELAWVKEKKEQMNSLILEVMGVEIEFNSNQESIFPGAVLQGEIIVNNPTSSELTIASIQVLSKDQLEAPGFSQHNNPFRKDIEVQLSKDFPFSQPYWLNGDVDQPMYTISDQQLIGKPFNGPSLYADLKLEVEGEIMDIQFPLNYKFNDPVDGEVKEPVAVVPSVDLELSKQVIFGVGDTKPRITVWINFRDKIEDGVLYFEDLNETEFRILESEDIPGQKRRRYEVEFMSEENGKRKIKAIYKTNSGEFDLITNRINYKHIPHLTYFTPATIEWIQADWKISKKPIGYIPGAGDEIPQILESLGYPVTVIGNGDYDLNYLSQFQAIVVGIRAYNTNEELASNQQALMGYVRAGGNLIVQYNTTGRLLTNQLGPYPFSITRDRVSVENAPVTANFAHPVLSTPNQINASDFEGWVQERGLYFAGQLDAAYETPLIMNDPGEDPSNGSLIYAKYGEGKFIYTGLSFFRELPAGVPGAVKLFINLLEQ
ncbi:PIG-L family deacetylase [Algoriphagus kandeliae]|uniref:PIG-L family deacetylase n=1 Tax=Algoriphagus kandeliae TaxID=2562278 RepID=A0A4Y9R084_9BACT|nr:PIG-L family deacetylase [Algoriphagus kandeliae]TFV97850.1 PIG-L family deacetylase [Algoriphagus kandeliae]